MTESIYKGRSFKAMTDDAIARLRQANQAKIDVYNQMANRSRAQAEQQALATQGAQQAQVTGYDYWSDPNSAFNRHLASLGKTREEYEKMSTLERQRDIIDPMLNEAWDYEMRTNPQLQQSNNVDRIKEQWFNQKRNMYLANFSAIEDREGLLDKGVNFLSDVGQGVTDVVGAIGDVTKPVFGQENWFAQGTDAIRTGATEYLDKVQSDAEQQRERYLGKKLAQGEYAEAGKLLAENPLMLLGEGGKVFGGVGGWGKGIQATAKLAGKGLSAVNAVRAGEAVANAGKAIGASMPAYAGVMNAGQTVQDLQERGVDVQSMEGVTAALSSALAGAVLTKLTPHNAERSIQRWLTGQGVSGPGLKAATDRMMEAARSGGLFSKTAKYAGRTGWNTAKAGVNEAAEEFGQQYTASLANLLVGDDGRLRSWDAIPDEDKDKMLNDAVASGFMGGIIGGGIGGVRNGLNRYGDAELSAQVRLRERNDALLNQRAKKRENIEQEVIREREAQAQTEQETAQAQEQADLQAQQVSEMDAQRAVRQAERAQEFGVLPFSDDIAEYNNTPMQVAQELENRFVEQGVDENGQPQVVDPNQLSGFSASLQGKSTEQAWAEINKKLADINSDEANQMVHQARQQADTLRRSKDFKGKEYNSALGMWIKPGDVNSLTNLASKIAGRTVAPTEVRRVLEQEVDLTSPYASAHQIVKSAMKYGDGTAVSGLNTLIKTADTEVVNRAKAEQTRAKAEADAERAYQIEQERLQKEAQRAKTEEERAQKEAEQAELKRKSDIDKGGTRTWQPSTSQGIFNARDKVLGALQSVGYKLTQGEVKSFMDNPVKFLEGLAHDKLRAEEAAKVPTSDGKKLSRSAVPLRANGVIAQMRTWADEMRNAAYSGGALEVSAPNEKWNAQLYNEAAVIQSPVRGTGATRTNIPSGQTQGQTNAQDSEISGAVTPLDDGRKLSRGRSSNRGTVRVPFNPAVVEGVEQPFTLNLPTIHQWISDVLGQEYIATNDPSNLVEQAQAGRGDAFNKILQKLMGDNAPIRANQRVGNGLIDELLQLFGFKSVPSASQTARQFIEGAEAQYLKNIHDATTAWLQANPYEQGNLDRSYERFVVSAVANFIKKEAIDANKLTFEKAPGDVYRAKLVTPKTSAVRSSGGEAMNTALTDDSLGHAVRVAMSSGSLAQTLGSVQSFFKPGEVGGRVVGRLTQLAMDNDVQITSLSKAEMESRFGQDVKGAYDNESGQIYIRNDLGFTQTAQTLVHEATHAYFNRSAFAYNAYIGALSTDSTVKPETYGLTRTDVKLMEDAYAMMDQVRDSTAYLNPRYGVNTVVDLEGNTRAYGLSFDKNNPEALAEFMSELYSSEGFRRATAQALAEVNETNEATGWRRVRALLRKIAEFFGFTNPQTQRDVAEFIENSMSLLGTVPYRVANGGVSRLATADEGFVSRFVTDANRGIQFYTFKQKNGLGGKSEGVASAYRNDNGTWNFEYINPVDLSQIVQKDGLTEAELADEAVRYNLQVLTRNGNTNVHKHLSETIHRVNMLYPPLAKAVTKLHQLLTNFIDVETATNFTNTLTSKLLWLEHNLHDRDAIFTWVDRMMAQLYKDQPEKWTDLQREVQTLRAQYLNEFTESGIGRKTMKDHRELISDWATRQGITVEQLSEMTYALMARERTEQFKKDNGGIDPYTGKPIRELGKVSGFRFNGKADDDGSAYFASLTAQQAAQVEEFRKMWIAMNDGMLDLEYASGVLSTEQYYNMRGKFYAPLKNEDSFIGAFYKRATGRHSKAKDPFTTWFEMAEARSIWALKQKEHSLLLDVVQDNALGNILQVNQTHRTSLKDSIGHQWRAPNMSDGTAWTVYKNGVRHTLSINDKGLQDIYRSAKTWEEKSGFWSAIAHITRAMSAVRTSLSPSFILTAYARDLLTSVVNIQAAFRTSEAGQVLSDAEAMTLAGKVVARSLSSVGGILKGKWQGTRGWQYDVFKRLGGGINMNARMDAEDYNRLFQNALMAKPKSPLQLTGQAAKGGVHKLMQISHATEDSVRFATFMEFLEMRAGRKFTDEADLIQFLTANPKLKQQAISASKHITGNFEVKGNNIGMRSLFMFFNASMVGGRNAAHMFDTRHGTHALKMMGVIGALSLASLAMMDADLGDDEDGKSKSSRVSATENGICWGMSGCMQLPHETRWISATMKAGYELLKGDISLGDAVKMVMRGLHQSAGIPFQVIGADGNPTAHSFTMGVMPTLAQLPFQLFTNVDQFGRDITPEYAYDANGQRIMNAADWQKAKLSDPDWAKGMAMFGQKWFGLDVSASQYNHIANFILGSVYTNGKKIAKGMNNGDSFSQIFGSVAGSGFTPKYNDYAMMNDVKDRIKELKNDLMMGDSVHNMVRGRDELKTDARYAKLVALEKQYEKAQRAMSYNGKSYAELIREKESAVQNDDIDLLLEANTGLDVLMLERQQEAGQLLQLLEEFEQGF